MSWRDGLSDRESRVLGDLLLTSRDAAKMFTNTVRASKAHEVRELSASTLHAQAVRWIDTVDRFLEE